MKTCRMPHTEFWSGKRVLLTGHTGFKGAWLAIWLKRLGANVAGISLPAATQPNLFELSKVGQHCDSHFVDIRNAEQTAALIDRVQPEVIFHLAAQPLVRASYSTPLYTFAVNVQGTANVLDALRFIDSIKVIVAVTTDKVYKNLEHTWPYRENDALGGYDPYSASKAAAEIVIDSYRKSYMTQKGVSLASARAGNVIGGGDWSEDRLIPDAVRAWQRGKTLNLRHPEAIRPWQHVLEPLRGYLVLAEKLWQDPDLSGAYNFGPLPHEASTVRAIIELARSIYGSGEVDFRNDYEGLHETVWLSLETSKSRSVLGISPRWTTEEAVQHTIRWYRDQSEGIDAWEACLRDLNEFECAT